MSVCLKCGGTGVDVDGNRCDCKSGVKLVFPALSQIPVQYQEIEFDKMFLNSKLPAKYGDDMERLYKLILNESGCINKNIVICAPPNSGKTVFAYSVYGYLYGRGARVPEVKDLIEVRRIILGKTGDAEAELLWSSAPIAFIKIPMDVPARFGETISTIVDRRVRYNGATIFLFNGSIRDLEALDTFGKFKALEGNGTFMSVEIKNYEVSRNE